MGRATRADVALAAGVASSTVSLVLNGHGPGLGIAEATIQRVNEAAERLQYIPRASASTLRKKRSSVIGLIMAELPDDPFVPVVHDVMLSMVVNAQQHGYFVLPITEPRRGDSDYAYVRRIASQIDFAGIVCETTSRQEFISSLLTSLNVPLVWLSMVNKDKAPSGQQHVMIDELAGVRTILDRLDTSPGASALFLTGPNTNYSRDIPVKEAFRGRLTTAQLPTWRPEPADLIDLLSNAASGTEVIWCANDGIALAALQASQLLGRAVPQDWSVIGFGDEEPQSSTFTGLTTVAWPLRELTALSVELLVAAIESTPVPGEQFVIPSVARLRTSARLQPHPVR